MSPEIPHDHNNETSRSEELIEEISVVDGLEYKKVAGPYTVREYFSHHTTEAGPGPGWGHRMSLLDEEYALKRFGRTFTEAEVFNPFNPTGCSNVRMGSGRGLAACIDMTN